MSAFNWRGQPSIFSGDPKFTGPAQRMSQGATKRRDTGRSGHDRTPVFLPNSLDTNEAPDRFRVYRKGAK